MVSTILPFSLQTKCTDLRKTARRKANNLSFTQWTEKWFTDWWGPEILTWFIALLSVLAILITLLLHNDRPLPEWKFGITLNALISIFATIGEVAMMSSVSECIGQLKWLWFGRKRPLKEFQAFDDASRGGLGSLKLFAKLRGMHWVSLGAAITVIGVAFGPFTQQVLSFPSKAVPAGNAFIPQVLGVNENDLTDLAINPQYISALSSGLSTAGGSLSDISAPCPGNCSWPQYASLGIDPEFPGYIPPVPCYNYTLQGYDRSEITFAWVNESDASSSSQTMRIYTTGKLLGIWPSSPTAMGTALDFYIMHQPLINSTSTKAVALECTLSYCAQTYHTFANGSKTVTNSNTTELLLFDPNSDTIKATFEGLSFNVSLDNVGLFSSFAFPSFYGYCINNPSLYHDPETRSHQYFFCTSDAASVFGIPIHATSGVASDVKLVVETIMDNVAISITNTMRQGGGGTTTIAQVNGTIDKTETYVKAEYLWLTLPIGLVFLTLIFLIATISESRRARTETWKSSSLAALQGLNYDLHRELGALHTMDEVEIVAEGLEVKIEMDGTRGWSLVRA